MKLISFIKFQRKDIYKFVIAENYMLKFSKNQIKIIGWQIANEYKELLGFINYFKLNSILI